MASGFHYTRGRGGVFDGTRYVDMAGNITEIVEEEMKIAGERGVEEGRKVIMESGTGRAWTGTFTDRGGDRRSGSSSARVHEGVMFDAVDFRVIRGKDVGLDVGWIHPGEWEDYFAAQDQGFYAGGYRAPQFVQGMGMIAHLRKFMRNEISEAIDRSMRRIINGL